MLVVRAGGDDGKIRPRHSIYVYSIESRLMTQDPRLNDIARWQVIEWYECADMFCISREDADRADLELAAVPTRTRTRTRTRTHAHTHTHTHTRTHKDTHTRTHAHVLERYRCSDMFRISREDADRADLELAAVPTPKLCTMPSEYGTHKSVKARF